MTARVCRDGFGGELDHRRIIASNPSRRAFHAASFEMSATRFIVGATPRSSASRFARIAGSSAITITSSKKRSTAGLAVASALSAPVKSPVAQRSSTTRLELLERAEQVVLGAVGEPRAVDGGRGLRFATCAGC